MKKLWLLAVSCFIYTACISQAKQENKSQAAQAVTKPQTAEFADQKYTEIGRKMFDALSKGDMAGYLTGYWAGTR